MAFPTVATKGTTYTTGGTATSSHVVDLPDGLVVGDRVQIAFIKRLTTALTWPASPAWTSLVSQQIASNSRLEVREHIVDGTEGWTDGSSVTITSAADCKGCAFPWRITGAHASAAAEAAVATGLASANPDPPSLDPTWDAAAEDTLWIAFNGRSANLTTSVYPLTDNQENSVATGASAVSGSICSEGIDAASVDPSAFTISSTADWGAATIAIRPSAPTPVEAAVASVIPAVTQAAAGVATVEASAGSAIPAVTQNAAATVTVQAAAASTIPAVTQSAAGTLTTSGSAASTIPAVTQAATGQSQARSPLDLPLLRARSAYMDLGDGQKAIVAVGRSQQTTGKIPVIYCHGASGTALLALDQFWWDDLMPIAAVGYPVIAPDLAGPQSWNNDAFIAAFDAAVAWAGANLSTRTDKVGIIADSMGAGALAWAWRNPAKVAGIALRVPVVALDAFHDRDAGGFADDIEAAYGGLAAYNAAVPTHDPAANHALIAPFGDRIRVWYATADELIPTAETLAFTTAVGAEATPVIGTHILGALTPPDVVAAWLAHQLTTNS